MYVTAFGILRLRSLFAAVMLAGIYSLVSAAVFTTLDAVDVAFTEAAVGGGISTILMLGVLSLTQSTERKHEKGVPWVAIAVVTLTGAALIYATFDMPHFADPNAPIHTHPIYHEFVNESYDKFHIPNVVTSVLGSYRGYDTFGETTVVFTAGIAVLILLGRKRDDGGGGRVSETTTPAEQAVMTRHTVQRVSAKILLPFILLFALYVQFHGDFGPGGGFQAGVIFAAGIILHGLIYGLAEAQRVFPLWLVRAMMAGGVLIYGGVGVVDMFLGGKFLDYGVLKADPAAAQHIGILLIEAGVGITVAGVMISLFYSFAGRRTL